MYFRAQANRGAKYCEFIIHTTHTRKAKNKEALSSSFLSSLFSIRFLRHFILFGRVMLYTYYRDTFYIRPKRICSILVIIFFIDLCQQDLLLNFYDCRLSYCIHFPLCPLCAVSFEFRSLVYSLIYIQLNKPLFWLVVLPH